MAHDEHERERDERAELAARIAEARRRAAAALARDADAADLRPAARGLGTALREAVEDRELWNELDRSRGAVHRLDAGQLLKLRTIAEVDWASVLDRLGNVPPPSSELLANELVLALGRSLDGEVGSDTESVREAVGRLAGRLLELSGAKNASRGQLRSALRRALPAAGRLALVVAVAAGGVALTSALAPLAAGPIAAFVVAVGIEAAKDVVKDGLLRVVDRVVHPRLPRGLPSDIGDQAVVGTLAEFKVVRLRQLTLRWVAVTRPRPPSQPPAVAPAGETRKLLETWTCALYWLWNVGADARPDDAEFDGRCERMADALHEAREALTGSPDPAAVAQTLRALDAALADLSSHVSRHFTGHFL